MEVGNAYVNRHTTGAIVNRQPFGGWKRSSVGPTAKAGGPNYVLCLGRWDSPGGPSHERAEASFAEAWAEEFSREHDPAGLTAEANVFRYRPLPRVLLRVDASVDDEVIAVARLAAETTGTPVEVVDDDALLAQVTGTDRVRLLGSAEPEVWAAVHAAGATVDDNPVVDHGRVELVRWMREQAISRTRHRYGTVLPD